MPPTIAARSRVAASKRRGRLGDDALRLRAQRRALGVRLGDDRLLLGDRALGLLEPLHDLQLGVLEVALAACERGELALEALRLLHVARGGQPLRVAGAPRIDHRDVGLDAGQLGPQIVADAEAGRELLAPAPGAERAAPARARPAADCGVRRPPDGCGRRARRLRGGGADLRGWLSRLQPTPLPSTPIDGWCAGARRADGGPCRDRTDDIHGVNVALYQLS